MSLAMIKSLNPMTWFKAPSPANVPVAGRAAAPEGPYTTIFQDWVAREVNPWLYEAIREAVSPIDGAINRIVTLDGIIRVEGKNARVVAEIERFMAEVQVNDLEQGLQAFYRSQGNELYEQGFTVGEPIVESGAGVVALRVADSKGVLFRRGDDGRLEAWYRKPPPQRGRRDGTDQLERVLRNSYPSATAYGVLRDAGYRHLDESRLVYAVFQPEADGPYGTSLMRSTEFDARVLLVMKNALYRTWERFGDPVFNVVYKTKAKVDQKELEARRKTLAANLASALAIKRSGNSADVVNAIGRDDELDITILGADGQVLEIEMPARHVLENIVSKTGLPSWLLGFHWSTAERLAERQGEIALQESRTRWETRKAGLKRVVALHLRARGITWQEGDWDLVQDLPSLQDLVAQAQARFLDAQTQFMLRNGGQRPGATPPARETDDDPKVLEITRSGALRFPGLEPGQPGKAAAGCCDHHKGAKEGGEQYVEDGEALMRLEASATRGLLSAWWSLYDDVLDALGLDTPKHAKGAEVFVFAASALSVLQDLEEAFVATVAAEDAELARSMYRAWLRGVENAAAEFEGADAVVDAVRESVAAGVRRQAMDRVTVAAVRALREDVIKELAAGAYDGTNPLDVARALRKRFEVHEYDFERLARTEIAQAQVDGKLAQYAAHGVDTYRWLDAGGSCAICASYAAGGPYAIGTGPVPVRDSHPMCRCSVGAW